MIHAINAFVVAYSKHPFVLLCFQFDIRVYVLLTSLDPLTVYMYDDGLVRIATERYTENVRSLRDSCIHITNFDVNRQNEAKYVANESPNQCEGHKVSVVRLDVTQKTCFRRQLSRYKFLSASPFGKIIYTVQVVQKVAFAIWRPRLRP